MTTRKKVMWGLLALLLLAGATVFGIMSWDIRWSARRSHQHCMKGAGLALRIYANDHGGRFPFHTNGFGDALLLLVKDEPREMPEMCGPDDDGQLFIAALTNGLDVAEAKCSRVYVQGLSESNDPNIAMLFDRDATRGGDHFRSHFAHYVREVCTLDGSMQRIRIESWPGFALNQIQLLLAAGIPWETAESYYKDTLAGPPRR
jgi:hypothetical protein